MNVNCGQTGRGQGRRGAAGRRQGHGGSRWLGGPEGGAREGTNSREGKEAEGWRIGEQKTQGDEGIGQEGGMGSSTDGENEIGPRERGKCERSMGGIME
jgi:hypothetical protein